MIAVADFPKDILVGIWSFEQQSTVGRSLGQPKHSLTRYTRYIFCIFSVAFDAYCFYLLLITYLKLIFFFNAKKLLSFKTGENFVSWACMHLLKELIFKTFREGNMGTWSLTRWCLVSTKRSHILKPVDLCPSNKGILKPFEACVPFIHPLETSEKLWRVATTPGNS